MSITGQVADYLRQTRPHTPGPWHVEQEHEGVLNVCSQDHGTFCRPARVNGDAADTVYGPIIRANANLIAAAPDLLEAIESILRSAGYERGEAEPTLTALNVGIRYLDAARAALAKAKGGA